MFSDFLNHPSGSKSVQGGREMMFVNIVWRISMECTAPILGQRTTRILQNILHMRKKDAINQIFWQNALKGQSHEIVDLRFFSSFYPIWAPDKQAKVVLILDSYSPRYSRFCVDPP